MSPSLLPVKIQIPGLPSFSFSFSSSIIELIFSRSRRNNNIHQEEPSTSSSSAPRTTLHVGCGGNGEPVGLGIIVAADKTEPTSTTTTILFSCANVVQQRRLPPAETIDVDSEAYTCVINHVEGQLPKKKVYYDVDDGGDSNNANANANAVGIGKGSTNVPISATSIPHAIRNYEMGESSSGRKGKGKGKEKEMMFFISPSRSPLARPSSADFLKRCRLCGKTLRTIDIYMYR